MNLHQRVLELVVYYLNQVVFLVAEILHDAVGQRGCCVETAMVEHVVVAAGDVVEPLGEKLAGALADGNHGDADLRA